MRIVESAPLLPDGHLNIKTMTELLPSSILDAKKVHAAWIVLNLETIVKASVIKWVRGQRRRFKTVGEAQNALTDDGSFVAHFVGVYNEAMAVLSR